MKMRLAPAIAVWLTCAGLVIPARVNTAQATQRDTAAGAVVKGTAVIRGVVVSDDAEHRPIRRVQVSLSGLPGGRVAPTDDAGRFEFVELPTGTYLLTASKAAYLTKAYGASRGGRPGTAIVLAAGQQTDVSIALTRGAVIGGVVRDGHGRPLAGADVGLLPAGMSDSALAFFTPQPVTTDDRGEYRLFGVPPGQYYVAAVVQNLMMSSIAGRRSIEENDALLAALQSRGAGAGAAAPTAPGKTIEPLPLGPAASFAPVFYPDTPRADAAIAITVAAGVERLGVDFAVAPVRAASIDGLVSGPVSRLDRVELTLVVDGPQFASFSSSRPILTRPPDAQGRFHYDNMPPGHYVILARAAPGEGDPSVKTQFDGIVTSTGNAGPSSASAPEGRDYVYARTDVDVDGSDLTGVSLPLAIGATLSGKVVFDRTTAEVPSDLTQIHLRASSTQPTSMSVSSNTSIGYSFLMMPSPPVRADGTWMTHGVPPAQFTLSATLAAAISKDWWLRSALFNGRDLLDGPFDVQAGQDMSGIVFTLTDRHNELSGTLTTGTGRAATEYFIIVCPSDPQLWTSNSRRVKSLRPGSDGTFSVKDLPAGEYLIAALTDVAPNEWNDPQFLATLVPAGVKVVVTDGSKTVQDFRIGRKPHRDRLVAESRPRGRIEAGFQFGSASN
jgi:hypothetical protein